MNEVLILKFLALAAFGALTLTAAAAPSPVAIEAAKGGNVLSVGKTKRFESDLTITLLAIKKDTRCPSNARCISAGNAIAVLRIKAGNHPARNYNLHLNGKKSNIHVDPTDPGDSLKFYSISIDRLSPDRIAGSKIRQSDYRLKLSIATAVEGPIVN